MASGKYELKSINLRPFPPLHREGNHWHRGWAIRFGGAVDLQGLGSVIAGEQSVGCQFELAQRGPDEFQLLVASVAHGGSDEVMFATIRVVTKLEAVAPIVEIEGVSRSDWGYFGAPS